MVHPKVVFYLLQNGRIPRPCAMKLPPLRLQVFGRSTTCSEAQIEEYFKRNLGSHRTSGPMFVPFQFAYTLQLNLDKTSTSASTLYCRLQWRDLFILVFVFRCALSLCIYPKLDLPCMCKSSYMNHKPF